MIPSAIALEPARGQSSAPVGAERRAGKRGQPDGSAAERQRAEQRHACGDRRGARTAGPDEGRAS